MEISYAYTESESGCLTCLTVEWFPGYRQFGYEKFTLGLGYTVLCSNLGCNSVNHVSQSESRVQIFLQFDWMARFSLLQLDVAKTWKNTVS